MKITPKIPKKKSITETATVDTEGKTDRSRGANLDQEVFHWEPNRMSYEAPSGGVFICRTVQSGDPEFITAVQTEEEQQ